MKRSIFSRLFSSLANLRSREFPPARRRGASLVVEALDHRILPAGLSAGQIFVTQAYQDLLSRAPETSALTTLGTALDQGNLTSHAIVGGILASNEFQVDEITAVYSRFLHRGPSAVEISNGISALGPGIDITNLEASVLGSSAYYTAKGGTDAGFTQALYQDVLGRGQDIPGTETWQLVLKTGAPHDQVAGLFLHSPEAETVATQSLYQQFLHRSADASGLSFAQNSLQGGTPIQHILAGIVSAPEYSAIALTPVAPSTPSLAPASDSGSKGDLLTNVNVPVFTGTSAVGSTVTILSDGFAVATTTPDGNGNFQVMLPTLADGVHAITATATNPTSGRTGPSSAAIAITIDTTAPAAPSTPGLAPASDSGAAGDNITNVKTPTFTGTAEAGSTITLTSDGSTVGTTTTDASGNYSVTTSSLADGTHVIKATAADAAGNISVASAAVSVTIDTAAPPAPSAPTLASASDSGTKGDNITNVTTPTLTGTAEPNSTVTILSDGAPVGSAKADGSGNYSVTTSALADAIHIITATAADAAGNVSGASAGLSLHIDTVAPVISGVSATPNPFSVATDTQTSIKYTLSENASVTVVILDSSNNVVKTLLTSSSQLAGLQTVAWNGTDSSNAVVADGTYTFTIDAVDAAGNAATQQKGTVQKTA